MAPCLRTRRQIEALYAEFTTNNSKPLLQSDEVSGDSVSEVKVAALGNHPHSLGGHMTKCIITARRCRSDFSASRRCLPSCCNPGPPPRHRRALPRTDVGTHVM